LSANLLVETIRFGAWDNENKNKCVSTRARWREWTALKESDQKLDQDIYNQDCFCPDVSKDCMQRYHNEIIETRKGYFWKDKRKLSFGKIGSELNCLLS
jgi:hypothetical protein